MMDFEKCKIIYNFFRNLDYNNFNGHWVLYKEYKKIYVIYISVICSPSDFETYIGCVINNLLYPRETLQKKFIIPKVQNDDELLEFLYKNFNSDEIIFKQCIIESRLEQMEKDFN